MSVKTLYRSFAGGVITPEMFGRLDLVKFQTGLAESNRFVTLPHGPAANDAGYEYVIEVKDSSAVTCLLPFIYSTTQSMVLEFGNLYVRFHTQGGTVLEAVKNITTFSVANPGVINSVAHGYATGDWVYVLGCGGAGFTGLNFRYFKVVVINVDNYRLTDLAGVSIDTSSFSAYTGGGTTGRVYEIVSPYSTADLFVLEYTQSADVMTITHTGYQQRELRRLGATNWQFSSLSFTPTQVAPASAAVAAAPASGATLNEYQVTSIGADGLEESYAVGAVNGATIAITAVTQANPGVLSVAAHGRTVGDPVWIAGALGMTQINGRFVVNSTPTAGTLSLKRADGTVVDTTSYPAYTGSGVIGYLNIANDLTVAGNINTISYPAAASAIRYHVYKRSNGLWGFIGATIEASFQDRNITPDTTRTPPIIDDPFTSANNYPAAVGYYGGRRWFAGTLAKLQNMWATQSGTESNMNYSIPTRDNDRISFRISSRQSSEIRHIVPLEDLVVLTSSGEWVIAAASGTVLTPSSIDPRPKGNVGASKMPPVLAGSAVLYGEDRGGCVHEFSYLGDNNGGYRSTDVTVMAPHYFDNFTLVQGAFVRAPFPLAWFVRSDGKLLSLTYMPEEKVTGWNSHSTVGTFESVCSVPESSEDVIYVIAKRSINGRDVRYIERKRTRLFASLADAFFVDSGVFYSGAAVNTVGGGYHLEGEEVSVLADGAVIDGVTVEDGHITLPDGLTASKIAYGIPIDAKFKTLPVSLETQALGQGVQKNVTKVYLRVNESSGIRAGPSYDRVKEVPQRTDEAYGFPPALVSDEATVVVAPEWNTNGQVCVVQPYPLPLTVMSMVTEVALGS